jgi:hypothetical protein
MTQETTEVQQATREPPEAAALASEMGAAMARLVEQYRKAMRLSAQEAVDRVEQPMCKYRQQRVMTCRPEEISWLDFEQLVVADRDSDARRVEEIQRLALDELQTGFRAALMSLESNPWERAQFLALRKELADQWQPRNGMERQLIDTMAQAQTAWMFWLRAVNNWALAFEAPRRRPRGSCPEEMQTITAADGMERAGAMADRFNKIFLRTLRALRDLRRYNPVVVVQNAGQVNVGGQQVNVAADATKHQ